MTVAWSFTRLDCFESCPAKYWYQYVTKRYPFVENEHTTRGNAAHSTIEARLKTKASLRTSALAVNEKTRTSIEWLEQLLLVYESLPASATHVELEVALTDQYTQCHWMAKNCRHRAKIDFLILSLDGTHALVVDWKTGRHYPAKVIDQASDYAMCVLALFPGVRHIDAQFVYLDDRSVHDYKFTFKDNPVIRETFELRAADLQASYDNNHWPVKPSDNGCRFCSANVPGGCPSGVR